MKCPRCKRKKIDPQGDQANRIIREFMVRYLRQEGSVEEEKLYGATYKMALEHELCFMENDECNYVVDPGEFDYTIEMMVKRGYLGNEGDKYWITEKGKKYYESLPQERKDEYKKMMDR